MTDEQSDSQIVTNMKLENFFERYEADQQRAQEWRVEFQNEHKEFVGEMRKILFGNGSLGLCSWVRIFRWSGAMIGAIVMLFLVPATAWTVRMIWIAMRTQ